ncbi:MAG: flavin prenyltransferase UbiX [Methylophilaceae bacterium]|jgi:4-hydroxy-3-polyprenylbenzoate decarboxylase|uniref:flavin prenyltransferase UbiX n=1 Tax=Methylobacillus sp. MM3 TaxID=1848039 RepID=UPI0007DF3049|nr:flavin prenyltransferase UbiX [Methylobacillus sp. MM3]OAJ69993.1 aromatic acid decarboxylase [Methylobacillus sp. MM3]
MSKTITLALTGASGMPYAMRLLESLLSAGHTVYLVYSQAAQFVAAQEMGLNLPAKTSEAHRMLVERYRCRPEQLLVFAREDWNAPIASGTGAADAMVVCPCTMGALAAIATGLSDNLIERAADVMLKEGRKLILVPRETPFSAIHLENMLKLSRMGAVMLVPNPGFYHMPKSVEDIVDFIVAKILDQLGVEHQLVEKWGSIALPNL